MTKPTPAAALREALLPVTAPEALGCDDLLAAVGTVCDAQAVLDAVKLRIAAELVSRSAAPSDSDPTMRAGHASPAALLAERWRIAMPAARRLCLVGDAVSASTGPAGEDVPAAFPALASALCAPLDEALDSSQGSLSAPTPTPTIGVEQAAVIVRELSLAAPACSSDALALGERLLVENAPDLTVAQLRALAVQVRDRLDDDGILSREKRRRQRRSLTISTTADGMTHVDWYLDPESAGYVVTAIDAAVGRDLRTVRFRDPDAATNVANGAAHPDGSHASSAPSEPVESRSMAQLRSDAATDIFRHRISCPRTNSDAVTGTAPVTVVVRIGLEQLRNGHGTGQLDGIPTPISAGTARRMAADANLIPIVLGGPSEVLDLGRSRRLFTRAQKLALAERDGGCAFTGCPHPPSYTEAHHIRWWNAHHGTTDLDNGILLCTSHHHRVHDDGWDIDIRDHVPYFIPPPHIDPHRRPRPGGRPTTTLTDPSEHAA